MGGGGDGENDNHHFKNTITSIMSEQCNRIYLNKCMHQISILKQAEIKSLNLDKQLVNKT